MGWWLVAASFAAGVRAELRCFRGASRGESARGGWRLEGSCGGHLVQDVLKQAQREQVAQEHVLVSLGYVLGAAP